MITLVTHNLRPPAGDSTSSTAAPTTVPTPTPDDGAVPGATDAAIDSIDVDALLRSDALVVLNVLPSFPDRGDMTFPLGMADHDLVFTETGNWDETRDRVGFYRLHAWPVRYVLSDEQLPTMVAYLDEHGIPLMFETEPLNYPANAQCTFTESFSGIHDLEIAQRIHDLGGQFARSRCNQTSHGPPKRGVGCTVGRHPSSAGPTVRPRECPEVRPPGRPNR